MSKTKTLLFTYCFKEKNVSLKKKKTLLFEFRDFLFIILSWFLKTFPAFQPLQKGLVERLPVIRNLLVSV